MDKTTLVSLISKQHIPVYEYLLNEEISNFQDTKTNASICTTINKKRVRANFIIGNGEIELLYQICNILVGLFPYYQHVSKSRKPDLPFPIKTKTEICDYLAFLESVGNEIFFPQGKISLKGIKQKEPGELLIIENCNRNSTRVLLSYLLLFPICNFEFCYYSEKQDSKDEAIFFISVIQKMFSCLENETKVRCCLVEYLNDSEKDTSRLNDRQDRYLSYFGYIFEKLVSPTVYSFIDSQKGSLLKTSDLDKLCIEDVEIMAIELLDFHSLLKSESQEAPIDRKTTKDLVMSSSGYYSTFPVADKEIELLTYFVSILNEMDKQTKTINKLRLIKETEERIGRIRDKLALLDTYKKYETNEEKLNSYKTKTNSLIDKIATYKKLLSFHDPFLKYRGGFIKKEINLYMKPFLLNMRKWIEIIVSQKEEKVCNDCDINDVRVMFCYLFLIPARRFSFMALIKNKKLEKLVERASVLIESLLFLWESENDSNKYIPSTLVIIRNFYDLVDN